MLSSSREYLASNECEQRHGAFYQHRPTNCVISSNTANTENETTLASRLLLIQPRIRKSSIQATVAVLDIVDAPSNTTLYTVASDFAHNPARFPKQTVVAYPKHHNLSPTTVCQSSRTFPFSAFSVKRIVSLLYSSCLEIK